MSDLAQAAGWIGLLIGGLAGCVVLKKFGLATTYVRDLLHVGAGVWVLGWPWWRAPALPLAIIALVVVGTLLVPSLAERFRWAARLRDSVAGGEERWSGLVAYTLSFLVFTALGLTRDPFPAAAALLALAWGDGIGGAIGRRFGRRRFAVPGGKVKTLEGSAAVAVAAGLGVLAASAWFGVPLRATLVFGGAVVAALAEALAPRASDNLVIPPMVWLILSLGS